MIQFLHEEIINPLKVFIIDKLHNERSGFIVYPNQKIKYPEANLSDEIE